MKTTHTPGPWRVDGLLIKAIDHGKWFGIAKASGTKLTIEGNMANAALIAAAPELLAALESLLIESIERDNIGNYDLAIDRAALAIAKAKGQP